MRKWNKLIALLGILVLCLTMFSGCMVGRNYSKEMSGNKEGLPKFQKDQEIEVPYTGEEQPSVIETDDPVLAGLCDADGNLTDGSGKVDLSNLGNSGSSGNSDSSNNGGGSSSSGNGGSSSNGGSGDSGDDADIYEKYLNDESGTKIRILDQNVRKNDAEDISQGRGAAVRKYRFQKLVQTYDPDVIGTQEADETWIDALTELFNDKYSMSYQYRGAQKGSDEACAILWKKDKYDLLQKGQFWLAEDPTSADPPGFGQYYPRIAHWVKLKDKATGEKFLIFSTHFGFPRNENHTDGYMPDDYVYLRGLFAKVCAQHSDAYVFIMGDFNLSYGSDPYITLNDGKDMMDSREIAQDMKADGHCEFGEIRKGTNAAFASDDGSSVIDFIFVQPRKYQAIDYYTVLYDRIAVEDKGIGVGPVSDHFGVLADFRVGTSVSYEEYYGKNAK